MGGMKYGLGFANPPSGCIEAGTGSLAERL